MKNQPILCIKRHIERDKTRVMLVPELKMKRQEYPLDIALGSCFVLYAVILLLQQQHFCISGQALLIGPKEEEEDHHHASLKLNRGIFPPDFVFGVGSSAYQYEGAADQGGREPSIWDTFTRLHPEKIADHSSGTTAQEFYYLYKEDVCLLKEVGWDLFRFSISWPRLVPHGKVSKGVNRDGIDFYNDLIDTLLANGIQPFATLFHWDVPQALEDEYGGFLSRDIVDDFHDYADLCFKEFGDRVKFWATVNEPNYFAQYGYADGSYAPGRCSNYIGNCSAGNSATEPYTVVHNLLLAHASAIQLYRSKYQESQNGKAGLSTSSYWMKPKFATDRSRKAALRAIDFQFGWIIHPITYGDYPKSMRDLVGTRLPKFTTAESEMLRGSYDYLGLNYYTARFVDESTSYSATELSYTTDCRCNFTTEKDGMPIGEPTPVEWLYMYPKGIRKLLHYVKNKYNPAIIYITENGVADANNNTLPLEDALDDTLRMKYHKHHLHYLSKAIKEGVNVKGYLAWSFLDDFEWSLGYTDRFGLTFIDYRNGLKRHLKDSSLWFKQFLLRENTTHTRVLHRLHVSQ